MISRQFIRKHWKTTTKKLHILYYYFVDLTIIDKSKFKSWKVSLDLKLEH